MIFLNLIEKAKNTGGVVVTVKYYEWGDDFYRLFWGEKAVDRMIKCGGF